MSVFGKISPHLQKTGSNTIKGDGDHNYCSAFGSQWFNSNDSNVITWKIQISQGNFNGGYLCIGIVSNYHKQDVNTHAKTKHSYIFWPYSTTEAINKLHRKVVAGDTIHLILDLRSKSLSYYLNDDKSRTNVLTKSIKTAQDIKYTFALSMNPYKVTSSITVTQSPNSGQIEESKDNVKFLNILSHSSLFVLMVTYYNITDCYSGITNHGIYQSK